MGCTSLGQAQQYPVRRPPRQSARTTARARGSSIKVAVIGHRGFVGSAIAEQLRSVAEVVGIDRSNYEDLRGLQAGVLLNADGSSDKRAAAHDPFLDFDVNVEAAVRSLADFSYDHYVLISSVEVYDQLSDPARNHEATPIDPLKLTTYGLHKLIAELVVRRYAASWTLFRLGPLVGPGLRKNPIFDLLTSGRLFVSPASAYPYIDTRDVGRIVSRPMTAEGEIFNVCGQGEVELADLARRLNIELDSGVYSLPEECYRINVEKLAARVVVPDSLRTVQAFAREWRPSG